MEKHRLALLLSLLISTCFCVIADDSGQSDDEPSPNTLGSIGSKDSIQIITPGPTVDPDAVLTLRVDPEKPGIPEVSNEYTVGSVGGAVSVGSMGAAVYEMPIECPEGRLNPSIGLVYNSQNMNYGLAGFGFSLSGLSVITRGEKTIFNNNGEIGGVGGEPDDFLYLDGKRLILMSGTAGKPGAEYCLEGDPHTRIIIHSTFNDSSNNIWFEVQTPDGKVYQYGCSPNSQISYKDDNGEERFVSWYIGQAEDIYGNYITYIYNVKDYYAYPLYVLYGNNYILNRGVSNKVVFEYRDLGANATYFRIGNKQGKIDQSIKSITTLSNETVFRKYQLDYDDTSDHSTGKFSRLVSIRKQNGHGESMPPTQFTWSHIPENAQKSSSLYLSTDSGSDLVKEESKVFFAADVTGDGVSDIVRVAPVKVTTAIGNGSSSWSNETWVYVSRSVVGEGNKVSYQSPLVYNLPKPYMTDHSQFNMGGSYLMDIDGDGYNDIIIPYHDYEKDKTNYAVMYCVLGRDVVAGRDRRSNRFVIKLDNATLVSLKNC